jgi:hypothetical protein
MQSKNKYFWKKQLESIVFDKSHSIYSNIFTNTISIFHFPSILLKLIKIQASNQTLSKSKCLLVYGKVILYKSGLIEVKGNDKAEQISDANKVMPNYIFEEVVKNHFKEQT